jgi:hypothetical protein
MKKYAAAIGEILFRHGALSKEDVQALKKDFTAGEPEQLNYFLLDEELVSKEELLKALSEYYEVPYFDVRGYQFNHDLLALFPQDFLVHNAVIPIEFDGVMLTVVTGNPNDQELREKIQQFLPQHVLEFRVGIVRDIVDEARAYYEAPPEEIGMEKEEEYEEESTEDITDLY